MNSNIKDRASSFFERLKVYAAFLIRYIVFICRKYPLIALAFLLFYAFFLYRFLSPNFAISSNNKNLPIPQQQAPTNSQTSNSSNSNLPNTAPVTAVEPAQATAVKSGSNLSIRWTKTIEDPLIYSEKELLNSSCSSRVCNISLTEPTSQIEVYWQQEGTRTKAQTIKTKEVRSDSKSICQG